MDTNVYSWHIARVNDCVWSFERGMWMEVTVVAIGRETATVRVSGTDGKSLKRVKRHYNVLRIRKPDAVVHGQKEGQAT